MVGSFYRRPLPQIGSATGAFLVMVVQGHPVLHAQFVESHEPRRYDGMAEVFGWREVTLDDMSLYGAKQEEQARATADAEQRAFSARRSARFWWLLTTIILSFEFARRLGVV